MSLTLKRNLPLMALLGVLVAALVLGLGSQRIIAYTTSTSTRLSTAGANDVSNAVALFDDGVVHEIQVLMSEQDYDSMIATYQQTGEKEYFQVDVIIDGVRINDVGIRLRGNASLRTALGGDGGGGFGIAGGGVPDGVQFPEGQTPPFGDGQEIPEGMQGFQPPQFGQGEAPEGMQDFQPPAGRGFQGGQPPEGFVAPDGVEGEGGGFGGFQSGGMGREAISEELTKIPFMIKFDEYVDGQTYQGYSAIAIRNYGTSYDEAMLQEPISNYAASLAGLPATETVFTGFSLNEDAERLYVVSELVDENYLAKHLPDTVGVLYKADVGASLSYAGEEPSSYANSFSQETRVNDADMKPLIDFMRFLDEADDATFEAELPERLDVDAFASYLAINAMLVNTDSMLGMNNNYYLYYDEQAEKMTVLLWDTNESLSKLGGNVSYSLDLSTQQAGFGGGGMGRGFGGGSNTLLSRFIANDTFRALYQQKLQEVYDAVFANDALTEKVDAYAALVLAANADPGLVDEQTYTAAVESVRSFLEQRKEYVLSTGLVSD